jgi:hypothetical protein
MTSGRSGRQVDALDNNWVNSIPAVFWLALEGLMNEYVGVKGNE